ncbi:hypothetical protein STHU_15550 [Allostella humosa]|nr:hypothetical protein STHU_15550 [Stella humosa]
MGGQRQAGDAGGSTHQGRQDENDEMTDRALHGGIPVADRTIVPSRGTSRIAAGRFDRRAHYSGVGMSKLSLNHSATADD